MWRCSPGLQVGFSIQGCSALDAGTLTEAIGWLLDAAGPRSGQAAAKEAPPTW